MQGQDANYAILTKRVKLQQEKKPESNLLSMQSVGFEHTTKNYETCKDKMQIMPC